MHPRLHILLAGLLFLTAGAVRAQAPDLSPLPPEQPALAPAALPAEPAYDFWGRFRPRSTYRYEAGDSIGRKNGLSSLQAFVPFLEESNSQSLAFVDARFLLFDDQTTPGTNVNLGFRSLLPGINRTLGGHVAYDLTDTNTNTFHQVSGGLESFGSWLDARANFYAPLGRQRRLLGSSTAGNADSLFQGQYLLFGGGTQTNLYENAMTGFDTEVGGNVVRFGQVNLRAFVGTYYFGVDNGPDTWGGRARVEARLSDTIALNLSVQRDRLFDTTVNLHVTLSWPTLTGRRRDDRGDYSLEPANRLGESVERIQQIVITRTTDQTLIPREVAIDPLTGAPMVFLHVAPGGHSDGTFENPYGTLAKAFADPRFSAGNVVVYDRTQGLFAGNVSLAPGTRLLSSGPVQTIDTLNGGPIRLPFSGAGTNLSSLPQIQGTVTMGNNTTLSGFALSNDRGNDLINQAPGSVVRNVRIDNNVLTGGNVGINLNNAAGSIDIINNRIQNANLTAINVQVQNDESATIRVTDNQIGGPGLNGIYMTVNDIMGMTANVNASVERNTVTGAKNAGISVNAGGNSQVAVSVKDNQVTGAVGSGIEVVSAPGNSVMRADVTGNAVSGSGSTETGGLFLSAQAPGGTPTLIARVVNNQLSENFTAGLRASVGPLNSMALDLHGNSSSSSLTPNDYILERFLGQFQVVDLSRLQNNNTGNVTVTGGPTNISTLP